MENKFRVAIVGGGIAGLVIASALSKSPDIEVHIYEAAHEFSEIGAGIGIFSRVWKIVCAMGLDKDLAAASNVYGSLDEENELLMFRLRKSNQPTGINYDNLCGRGITVLCHRVGFQQAILKQMPASCSTHVSKRVVSLEEPSNLEDPVKLHFQDGSTASCDILIGADGIKSAVRAEILNRQIDALTSQGNQEKAAHLQTRVNPMWTGSVAYRGVFPQDALTTFNVDPEIYKFPSLLCGKNKHITVFPIAQGKLINVVAFVSRPELEGTEFDGPTVTTVTQEELLSAFSDFEKGAQDLLRCVEKPSRWAIHAMRPLDSYISQAGRVAIIGDAAHAMTPHQGSGAGQAIEDAYILSALLTHPGCTRRTLPEALKIYDETRRPFSQSISERSRRSGLMYEFDWPESTDNDVTHGAGVNTDRADEDGLGGLGKAINENLAWVWSTTIDEDRSKAIAAFERYLQNNP